MPAASSSPRRAPGRRRARGTRTPPRRDCEVWGKNEAAVCVASLGASDAVWRASGSSYTAPLERLFGAGAGLVGLGVYAGAARCRADALGGEVPSGAAAACCVLRGAGAAITLLYGVSDGIHDEQKARLALLKFSPEASADPDPSVLGLAGRVVALRAAIAGYLRACPGRRQDLSPKPG